MENKMKNLTVKVVLDESSSSPRENDNFSHFAMGHKKYNLGDKDASFDLDKYSSWDQVKKMLVKERDAFVIVPVSATDHSSFRMFPGVLRDFDSGQIGFAYATREEVIKEFGDDSAESIKKANSLIHGEIEEYSQWYNGEVYRWEIRDETGEIVDSCGGYYEESDALKDANFRLKELQAK